MSKLISILLPTRKRVPRLIASLQSLLVAGDPEKYEVLLRVDDDDDETWGAIEVIQSLADVRLFTGPRGDGWADIPKWCNEMLATSDAKWFLGWNDDCVLRGTGWLEELALVPTEGFICQPAIHQLGGSTYPRDAGSPFSIYPNHCWEKAGWAKLAGTFDTGLSEQLQKRGWKVHFLESMAVHHQRDSEDVLVEHRK